MQPLVACSDTRPRYGVLPLATGYSGLGSTDVDFTNLLVLSGFLALAPKRLIWPYFCPEIGHYRWSLTRIGHPKYIKKARKKYRTATKEDRTFIGDPGETRYLRVSAAILQNY